MNTFEFIKQEQIHHMQYCLSSSSFIMKIFMILDFESEINVKHR